MTRIKTKSDFFERWGDELQKYCEENKLDFDFLKKRGSSHNFKEGYIWFHEPWTEECQILARLELEGKIPKQLVKSILMCEFTTDKLIVTQTEYTQKILVLKEL